MSMKSQIKKLGAIAVACLLGTVAVSADDFPLDTRIIMSGHSLTDPIFEPLSRIVSAAGHPNPVIAKSTIPGSPMEVRWSNAPGYDQPDARADIGDYDLLVITERVSLSGTMPWHHSEAQALQWFENAWTKGAAGKGAATILYATWISLNSGPDYENPDKDPEGLIPFRERLPLEMDGWLKIQSYVNSNRPAGSPEMALIPGPLLMAAIYDDIAAGKVPGVANIRDLFSDDIHVNAIGGYFMALAHYAVIYGRDPRSLPDSAAPPEVGAELDRYLRDTVWRVLDEM